jgi:hypothetical protein
MNAEQVRLLGYGVYEGDVVPDRPLGMFGDFDTWEAVAKFMAEDGSRAADGSEWTAENVGMPNPKIVLDSGVIVWGAECWWGPEAQVKSKVSAATANGAKLVEVDPTTVEGLRAAEEAGT